MYKSITKITTLLLSGIFLCILIMPAVAQEPEINGYEGDKPLLIYSHDTIKGGLIYSTGDSYYSGKLYSGDTYSVLHTVSLPDDAIIKSARLYNYWTWSAESNTGIFPDVTLNFDQKELTPEIKYDDRKGWDIYDYPSGTWVYDVTDHITGSGSHTVIIEHTGSDDAYFSISGLGLLIIYEDVNGRDMEYWVGEGCDMLNSKKNDDGTPTYYTTPAQTITEMMAPAISLEVVKSATLWTIVQGGNWDANNLKINDVNITGICGGTPYSDLDIDERDITEHLIDGDNVIQFQAVDDYAIPCGSILVIEKDVNMEESTVGTEHPAADSTPREDTPGFGVISAAGLLLVIAFIVLKKN